MLHKKFILFFVYLFLFNNFCYADDVPKLVSQKAQLKEPVQFELSQEKDKLLIDLIIEDGYHIYSNKKGDIGYPFQLTLTNISNLASYKVFFPQGLSLKNDPHQGISHVYEKNSRIIIELTPLDPQKLIEVQLDLEYGACKDFCAIFSKQIDYTFEPQFAQKPFAAHLNELLFMVIFGIIGGLFLNFMPCVLPVLSLKIFGIIRSKKFANTKTELLFTIAGIISTLAVLSIIVISLRNLGHSVGWGMHFHEPIFLMVLVIILVFFADNLWGNFTVHLKVSNKILDKLVNISEKNWRYLSSFASGVLTTLLATPCAAPYISTSVAFAITQKSYAIFIIYLSIGLGMALPYILMIIAPNILKIFPKPGAWMLKLQKIMALCLVATTLWLLYILFYQLTIKSFLLFVAILIITRFILSNIKDTRSLIVMATILAISSIATPLLINNLETNQNLESYARWTPYSSHTLSHLLEENRIVLLDVTASWCVNCHYNKYFVLEQEGLIDFLERRNVVLMRADYTTKSEGIAQLIKEHNRVGIPLNIVYCPKTKIILPEILSQKDIVSAVNQCN